MEAEVPDKLYFKIGEVAKIASLKPSVLRYWETEFSELRPTKTWSGQRCYTKSDLDLVFRIKKMLYLDKLTIEGARKQLGAKRSEENDERSRLIDEIRQELQKIRDSLV